MSRIMGYYTLAKDGCVPSKNQVEERIIRFVLEPAIGMFHPAAGRLSRYIPHGRMLINRR